MSTLISGFSSSAGTAAAQSATGAVFGPVTATQSGFGSIFGGSSILNTVSGVFDFASDLPLGNIFNTGVQAYSQMEAARLQAQQSMFQSQQAALNATIANRNAELALQSAALKAADTREETRERIARIRNIQAKSGAVTTAGSPLLVQLTQAAEGEQEAQRQLYEGDIEAYNYRAQAASRSLEASQYSQKAESQKEAGLLSATTTIGGSLLL